MRRDVLRNGNDDILRGRDADAVAEEPNLGSGIVSSRTREDCHTEAPFRATPSAYESQIGRQDKVQIGGDPGPGSFIMRFGFD